MQNKANEKHEMMIQVNYYCMHHLLFSICFIFHSFVLKTDTQVSVARWDAGIQNSDKTIAEQY